MSGCFDMLYSGHIAFLDEASHNGDVYLGFGYDKTIKDIKGRDTIYSKDERVYMLKALRCVKDVSVYKGSRLLDFLPDLMELKPDIYIVSEDGHSHDKEQICRELGMQDQAL